MYKIILTLLLLTAQEVTIHEGSSPLDVIELFEMSGMEYRDVITIELQEVRIIGRRGYYRYDVEYHLKGWWENVY